MRVLLADDDPNARLSLRRLLEPLGFTIVAEAADGEEALRALQSARVDVIMTDCQMPRMDGIRLTRALRAAGVVTPVFMLSGVSDRLIIDAALRAGVTRFIAKPVDFEVLCTALRQTLGRIPRAA